MNVQLRKRLLTACLFGLFGGNLMCDAQTAGDPPAGGPPSQGQGKLPYEYAIQLFPGEQRVLSDVLAKEVSMGMIGIVEVEVLPDNTLLLTALETGQTELTLWTLTGGRRTYLIDVLPSQKTLFNSLSILLKSIENIKMSVVGGKVVLDGRLLTKGDAERVDKIVAAFGKNNVVNLTILDRGPENSLVEVFIQKMAGLENVKVKIVGNTAYLSGFIYNEKDRKRVIDIAKTQIDKIVDLMTVHELMIDCDIMFVRVSKGTSSDVGVNILNSSSGLLTPSISVHGQRSRVNGDWSTMDVGVDWTVALIPRLNIMLGTGDGQILARPHIVTKNGEKGYFQSGGEYYYEVSGVQAAELKMVQYGLMLHVQPTFKNDEEVIMTIKIDVKMPIPSSSGTQLSLETYTTENIVSCRLGQSIVLSGLIQNIKNVLQQKTPLLGSIPILNLFFSNRTKSDTDTELITIITPRITNLPETSLPPYESKFELVERFSEYKSND